MKAASLTDHIKFRKTSEDSWGLKNTLEYHSFLCLFFGDGARGNLCHTMKEAASEQRVTAKERKKANGSPESFHIFKYKIRVKCCK